VNPTQPSGAAVMNASHRNTQGKTNPITRLAGCNQNQIWVTGGTLPVNTKEEFIPKLFNGFNCLFSNINSLYLYSQKSVR
jgi:hypothetical protein